VGGAPPGRQCSKENEITAAIAPDRKPLSSPEQFRNPASAGFFISERKDS
jgi:hypothetical protein